MAHRVLNQQVLFLGGEDMGEEFATKPQAHIDVSGTVFEVKDIPIVESRRSIIGGGDLWGGCPFYEREVVKGFCELVDRYPLLRRHEVMSKSFLHCRFTSGGRRRASRLLKVLTDVLTSQE